LIVGQAAGGFGISESTGRIVGDARSHSGSTPGKRGNKDLLGRRILKDPDGRAKIGGAAGGSEITPQVNSAYLWLGLADE
jgi:hypothetical protein